MSPVPESCILSNEAGNKLVVPCPLSPFPYMCPSWVHLNLTRSRTLAMHALLKHSQSRTAQSFRINSLAKELVLLRVSIVLLKLEQQLLVDLVLVIPPALVPTDLI